MLGRILQCHTAEAKQLVNKMAIYTHVSLEHKAAKCMLPGCDKMALLTNLLFVWYTRFVIGERHERSTFVVNLKQSNMKKLQKIGGKPQIEHMKT